MQKIKALLKMADQVRTEDHVRIKDLQKSQQCFFSLQLVIKLAGIFNWVQQTFSAYENNPDIVQFKFTMLYQQAGNLILVAICLIMVSKPCQHTTPFLVVTSALSNILDFPFVFETEQSAHIFAQTCLSLIWIFIGCQIITERIWQQQLYFLLSIPYLAYRSISFFCQNQDISAIYLIFGLYFQYSFVNFSYFYQLNQNLRRISKHKAKSSFLENISETLPNAIMVLKKNNDEEDFQFMSNQKFKQFLIDISNRYDQNGSHCNLIIGPGEQNVESQIIEQGLSQTVFQSCLMTEQGLQLQSNDLLSLQNVISGDGRRLFKLKSAHAGQVQQESLQPDAVHKPNHSELLIEITVSSSDWKNVSSKVVAIRQLDEMYELQRLQMQNIYSQALNLSCLHKNLDNINSIINLTKYHQNKIEKLLEKDFLKSKQISLIEVDLKQMEDTLESVARSCKQLEIQLQGQISIQKILSCSANKVVKTQKSWQEITHILNEVASVFQPQVLQKQIQVTMFLNGWNISNPNKPSFYSNKKQISLDWKIYAKTFYNIYLNAVETCKLSGTIKVTLFSQSRIQDGNYLFDTTVEGTQTEFVEAPFIIPFKETVFQAKIPTNRKGQDCSYGLQTASLMMEAHGGTLNAYSAQESGTQVRFTIPAEISFGQKNQSQTQSNAGKKSLLEKEQTAEIKRKQRLEAKVKNRTKSLSFIEREIALSSSSQSLEVIQESQDFEESSHDSKSESSQLVSGSDNSQVVDIDLGSNQSSHRETYPDNKEDISCGTKEEVLFRNVPFLENRDFDINKVSLVLKNKTIDVKEIQFDELNVASSYSSFDFEEIKDKYRLEQRRKNSSCKRKQMQNVNGCGAQVLLLNNQKGDMMGIKNMIAQFQDFKLLKIEETFNSSQAFLKVIHDRLKPCCRPKIRVIIFEINSENNERCFDAIRDIKKFENARIKKLLNAKIETNSNLTFVGIVDELSLLNQRCATEGIQYVLHKPVQPWKLEQIFKTLIV